MGPGGLDIWDPLMQEIVTWVTLTSHNPQITNLPLVESSSAQQQMLVGGFNPFEKYLSKWDSSPSRGENKKHETTTWYCHAIQKMREANPAFGTKTTSVTTFRSNKTWPSEVQVQQKQFQHDFKEQKDIRKRKNLFQCFGFWSWFDIFDCCKRTWKISIYFWVLRRKRWYFFVLGFSKSAPCHQKHVEYVQPCWDMQQ